MQGNANLPLSHRAPSAGGRRRFVVVHRDQVQSEMSPRGRVGGASESPESPDLDITDPVLFLDFDASHTFCVPEDPASLFIDGLAGKWAIRNFSPARARSAATCRGRPALELDARGYFSKSKDGQDFYANRGCWSVTVFCVHHNRHVYHSRNCTCGTFPVFRTVWMNGIWRCITTGTLTISSMKNFEKRSWDMDL